VRTKSHLGGLN